MNEPAFSTWRWAGRRYRPDVPTAAHHAYLRWGAGAKANDLVAHHPALLTSPAPLGHAPPAGGIMQSEGGVVDTLDMLTVLKAAQAISSEIVLDRLLVKLIKIIIENAGTQKGVLILEEGGTLAIQALGWAEQELVTVVRGAPVEQSEDVSAQIIDHVWEAGDGLVVPKTGRDDRFAGDPYIGSCAAQIGSVCAHPEPRPPRWNLVPGKWSEYRRFHATARTCCKSCPLKWSYISRMPGL